MDWDKLKSFHAAAETGSLTAAGERLGISQSAVSRQIQALEESVGVPLFQRHARGLILTEPGRLLSRATADMARAARTAEATLRDAGETPSGVLKVTAPVAFGTQWLSPRLGAFRASYPEMRLQLILDDREYDLLTLEAEAAIRLWAAQQQELIQRRLAAMHTSLYASPDYLAVHGAPEKAADLDRHILVGYGGGVGQLDEVNWALRVGRDDKPPRVAHLELSSILAILRAVEGGVGIAALPDYLARGNERLVRLLPDLEGPRFEIYFVYPSDLRKSRRIQAFRDFLTSEFAAWSS